MAALPIAASGSGDGFALYDGDHRGLRLASIRLTGRLDLQIFPSGTLRGYYHTSFYKLYIPVAGGRDGNYIWFDIGPSSIDLGLGAGPQGKLHVVATMNSDGSFKGQVYPETAAVLSGLSMQYNFANPPPPDRSQNSTNDQYIFSATPTTHAGADTAALKTRRLPYRPPRAGGSESICLRKSVSCQSWRSFKRVAERRHPGEANAVSDLPIRHAVRIVFDAVLGELRRMLVEAARDRSTAPRSAAPWQTAQFAP